MRSPCLPILLPVLAVVLLTAACQPRNRREAEIERLQAQLEADRDFLIHDAETADPSRLDLKVTFVESSIMDIRPTNNPDRPWVGHVRIKWKFDYVDGRPLGFSAWDYVYALDKTNRWFKADEVQPDDPVLPDLEPAAPPDDVPLPGRKAELPA